MATVGIDRETLRRLTLKKANTGIPFKYIIRYLVLYSDFPEEELKELWDVESRQRSKKWGRVNRDG